MKFTKSQQKRINSCKDERTRQNWIEHFTHINEMKIIYKDEIKENNRKLRPESYY